MVQQRLFLKGEKAREEIRQKPCCICGSRPVDPCHIKSFGSTGLDIEWNMVPMCRQHHQQQHRIGIMTFYQKYLTYQLALREKGWYVMAGKLWNDKFNDIS